MGNHLKGKEVLVFGVSYRPNIGDSRFSPTEILVRELESRGAIVLLNDPVVGYWDEMNVSVTNKMPCKAVDGVILAVAHTAYKDQKMFEWLSQNTSVIVDAANILSVRQHSQLKEKGLQVHSIGRGSDT